MTWEDSTKQLAFQEGSMGAEQVPPGQRLRPPTLGSGSSDGPGQGGPGWGEAGTHIRTFSGQEEDLPQAPERHLKEPGILLGILDLTAMLP